jgi:hypothetical protein
VRFRVTKASSGQRSMGTRMLGTLQNVGGQQFQ